MMNKLLLILLVAPAIILCSCAKTPERDAEKVAKAINSYCDLVEEAISDEIIDDSEIDDIKDSEAEYISVIKSTSESYGDDTNGLSQFQQLMYNDNAWQRLAETCYKLAETEGYAKLSLTDK